MIKVYKYLNTIMSTIFKLRQNTHNLRNFHIFQCQNPKAKKFGLDNIWYRASQLWKNSVSRIVKELIKTVPLISWLRNCCKKYTPHVDYI